jgi:hypothetical protein
MVKVQIVDFYVSTLPSQLEIFNSSFEREIFRKDFVVFSRECPKKCRHALVKGHVIQGLLSMFGLK